jgi:hypothetical protein
MTNISFLEISPVNPYRLHFRVLVLIFLCFLPGCILQRNLSQGIEGEVRWFEGDLMPGPEKSPAKGVAVKREVYIYRLTRTDQAEIRDQVFFSNIETQLIKRKWTDKEGGFSIRLKPGTYSVFTMEPQGLFANRFSGDGYINPVEVRENSVTQLMIRIDYMAAY